MKNKFGSNGPIALTGATGFLGRAVLAELLATRKVELINREWKIGFDTFGYAPTETQSGLGTLESLSS